MVQAPRPLQAPLQPAKRRPRAGRAVSRTDVPAANARVQRPGHEIPAGELVTRPLPTSATRTVCGSRSKTAVTVFGPSIVTVHGSSLQSPVQPPSRQPAAETALSWTESPLSSVTAQPAEQSVSSVDGKR